MRMPPSPRVYPAPGLPMYELSLEMHTEISIVTSKIMDPSYILLFEASIESLTQYWLQIHPKQPNGYNKHVA